MGRIGPDVSGLVTHLHDGGHDAEGNYIVKKIVTKLKRVIFT
jgi:hypothetical protein